MSPIKSYTLTFIFFLFSLLSFGQQNEFQTSGDEYYSNQDYENAFTSFKKCYETDSLNVKCLQSAGLSAYRLGDIPEARKLFLELIKTDSTNRIGLTQLATIFEQSKNTPKAIKYYNQLTKIFPDNAVFYRKLAQQYQGAGLMTEAFTNYLKANALNKRDLFT
ncbi:MAG: tetratricopeptide repeat protein, partial [Saprospiraceae bacterium]|nr:tetratricopeptide repeat protein [Saprospiraceae bacterium]